MTSEGARGRIRALVAEDDESRRDVIIRALCGKPAYEVIDSVRPARSWREAVANECPELVIGSAAVLESSAFEHVFPVCIAIGKVAFTSDRFVCALDEPITHDTVTDALSTATTRILNVKAAELSTLISHYVAHRHAAPAAPLTIEAEREGKQTEVAIADIYWVAAAGNYVRLYTVTGAYKMRATIRHVSHRLSRFGFIRIHRGTVVNSTAIRERIRENEEEVAVVLADGTRHLIGPSFVGCLPGRKLAVPSPVI